MLLLQKKRRKKIFGTFFPFLRPWDRKSDKYGAVHKSQPRRDINLKIDMCF